MNKPLIALKPFLESDAFSMTLYDHPHTYFITKTPMPRLDDHEVLMIHIADIWEYTDKDDIDMEKVMQTLQSFVTRYKKKENAME